MNDRGFIQLILIIVLLLIIISLLGVSLSNVVQNPTLKSNFSFAWRALNYIWINYLEHPSQMIWKNILVWFDHVERKLAPHTGQ